MTYRSRELEEAAACVRVWLHTPPPTGRLRRLYGGFTGPKYMLALKLREEGRTYQQVADALGITRANASMYVRKARQRRFREQANEHNARLSQRSAGEAEAHARSAD